MYTASRSSIIGYLSTPLLLIFLRKFKYAFFVTILSLLIFSFNKELSKRISQTFQIKQILVNEKTGQVYVPQHITSQNLPAGSAYVQINKQNQNKITNTPAQTDKLIQEATASGKLLTSTEAASLVANSKDVTSISSVVADTSFSTRLQVEWPRAINAFKKNPILGTGASSITESSDGDYFRWLGEFGLAGFISFTTILFILSNYIFQKTKEQSKDIQILFYSFIFALMGLMINGILIDVFEASKVAFMFWFTVGSYIGYLSNAKQIPSELNETSGKTDGKINMHKKNTGRLKFDLLLLFL